MNPYPCRLYLITPPQFELDRFTDSLKQALDGGDVASVQLRMKDVSADEVRRAGEKLLRVCKERNVPFLVNDSLEVMQSIGADGVHVGEEEGAGKEGFVADLRKTLGEQAIIGVSCYNSRDLGMVAGEEGADYVSFGAFFDTTTKQPKARAESSILTWWSMHTVLPCVAIGGITPTNCASLVTAGADFLAVISAVWQYEGGPKKAVAALNEAIKAATPARLEAAKKASLAIVEDEPIHTKK